MKLNNQLNYSVLGGGGGEMRDWCIFCSSEIAYSGEARFFGDICNILKATLTMF